MQISLTAACALTISVGAISSLTHPNGLDEHKELGSIEWSRKLEPALARATASQKPVMLLFQEIPG